MHAHDLPAETWIDALDDDLLETGELDQLIAKGSVSGLTSNPSILETAFSNAMLNRKLTGRGRFSAQQIYQQVTREWIVAAADRFRGIHEASDGQSGYVSLELPPALALSEQDTISAGIELARAVNRPNLMIKIPGTREGLVAATALLSQGIAVNVTLLITPERFDAVAAAYLTAISKSSHRGRSARSPSCVASFFLNRLDIAVDQLLRTVRAAWPDRAKEATRLIGTAGLSTADAVWSRYQAFIEEVGQPAELRLRPLWASTSVKDENAPALKYVHPLRRSGSVMTLSRQTLRLWLRHIPNSSVVPDSPREELSRLRLKLRELDVDLDALSAALEARGLKLFEESFARLMNSLEGASRLAAEGRRRARP
jgi:transaldolase